MNLYGDTKFELNAIMRVNINPISNHTGRVKNFGCLLDHLIEILNKIADIFKIIYGLKNSKASGKYLDIDSCRLVEFKELLLASCNGSFTNHINSVHFSIQNITKTEFKWSKAYNSEKLKLHLYSVKITSKGKYVIIVIINSR